MGRLLTPARCLKVNGTGVTIEHQFGQCGMEQVSESLTLDIAHVMSFCDHIRTSETRGTGLGPHKQLAFTSRMRPKALKN